MEYSIFPQNVFVIDIEEKYIFKEILDNCMPVCDGFITLEELSD